MRRFSDIPQFIFNEYINNLLSAGEDTVITEQGGWDEVLFVNENNMTFVDINNVTFNKKFTVGNKSDVTKSYLYGPVGQSITTKGGEKITAYAKTNDQYKEIELYPQTEHRTVQEDWVGEYYNFGIGINKYPTESSTISYSISGNNYNFIRYESFADPYYKTVETDTGWEIYFRNDSVFCDWISKKYPQYINVNKDFIYMGRVFPYEGVDQKCRIFRFALKDYVINSIPQNNRNKNLIEFFGTCFDEVYSKIFNQQKQIKTLYDSKEMDVSHINKLSSFFDVNLEIYSTTKEDRLRDLSDNLPTILKKKGTYSSLIGIWKFVAGFNSIIKYTDINVYEWWHDSLPTNTYTVPVSAYEKINYLNQYESNDITKIGCSGEVFYNKFTDTYPDFYETNLTPVINNSYIHKQIELSTEWDVTHWINEEELLVQCYDSNFNEIWPKSVEILDRSRVKVVFNKETIGYCIVLKVEYSQRQYGNFWDITHYINKRTILTQSFDSIISKFMPSNVYQKNTISSEIESRQGGYGFFTDADYIYYHIANQSTWTITHNLKTLMMAQTYDMDDNQIIPVNISQNDLNSVVVEFNKNTNGYVILKDIGDPNKYIDTNGKILSPHYTLLSDLTCRPVDPDAILSEQTSLNLLDNWESMRPAGRIAHYHFVFSPISDFSGNKIGTYSGLYEPYWISLCLSSRIFDNISTFNQNVESVEWNIYHNTKTTNLLVVVYDNDNQQIIPNNIEIVNWFTVKVIFDEPATGTAVLIDSDQHGVLFSEDEMIQHTYDYVISQFSDYNKTESVMPLEIINNLDQLSVRDYSEDSNYYLLDADLLYEQTTLNSSWTITHNYETTGVFAQFFDSNWERIFPDTFTLSANQCTVEFEEPIKGYALIRNIGFIRYKEDIMNDLLNNGCYVLFGNGNDKTYIDKTLLSIQNEIGKIYINTDNIYKSGNDLYIDIEIEKDNINLEWDSYDIKEMALINSNQSRMYFYSQGSEIYKADGSTLTIHYRLNYDDI